MSSDGRAEGHLEVVIFGNNNNCCCVHRRHGALRCSVGGNVRKPEFTLAQTALRDSPCARARTHAQTHTQSPPHGYLSVVDLGDE